MTLLYGVNSALVAYAIMRLFAAIRNRFDIRLDGYNTTLFQLYDSDFMYILQLHYNVNALSLHAGGNADI